MFTKCQNLSGKIIQIDWFDEKDAFKCISEDEYPIMLKCLYKVNSGEELNLEDPKTFNEKMQWYKIYDRNPLKTELADKYLVRKYVKEKIGEEYLVPLYGVWDKFDDIDFGKLPNQFVLQCNHGSSFIVIVKDKSTFDIQEAKNKFDKWLNTNFAFTSFELQYKDIKPKIIALKYLEDVTIRDSYGNPDLPDYKFFCFDGKFYCSYVMEDYRNNHKFGKLGLFNKDFNLLPYNIRSYNDMTDPPKKPKNYEKMIELAEILSKGFSHVRVDFYDINDQIYFGEMTFTSGSGMYKYNPPEFNRILGDQWNLIMDK